MGKDMFGVILISFLFLFIRLASGVGRARIGERHAIFGSLGENDVTPASVVDAVPLCWLSSSGSGSGDVLLLFSLELKHRHRQFWLFVLFLIVYFTPFRHLGVLVTS